MTERPKPRVSDEELDRLCREADAMRVSLDLRAARQELAAARDREQTCAELADIRGAQAEAAEASVAMLREALEKFRWAAAPERHQGTSAYPYEEICEVLAATAESSQAWLQGKLAAERERCAEAIGELGIHPVAIHQADGTVTQRTEQQTGWNLGVMDAMKAVDALGSGQPTEGGSEP